MVGNANTTVRRSVRPHCCNGVRQRVARQGCNGGYEGVRALSKRPLAATWRRWLESAPATPQTRLGVGGGGEGGEKAEWQSPALT